MNIEGLYIGGVQSLGSGRYRLNDCYIQANWTELRINDAVVDVNANTFIVVDYQNSPQRASENLWLEVEWADYPNTNVAPVDNIAAGDYLSGIGSLVKSGFTPDISYLCRIAVSDDSFPAYHYEVSLVDPRPSEPGAGLGAVGDYILDNGGRVYEIVEWTSFDDPVKIKDIAENPHISTSRPVVGEYAYLYRPTENGVVSSQGVLHDLSTDALDGAVNYNNTTMWQHRGVRTTKDAISLDNVTDISIGDGINLTENPAIGWKGGKSVEISSTSGIDGSFTGGQRLTYTATAGQAIFAVEYTVGFVDVWMNGFKLVSGQDFTASSGTTILLTDPANNGDIIDIISNDTFTVANHYTKLESDSKYIGNVGNYTIDGELDARAFNLISTREQKENIQMCMDDAINLINRIEIVEYNYKTDESKTKRVGFIAEDTEELFSGWNQVHFDVGNTVGVLIKAVQELNNRIEKLESDKDT